MCGICGVVDNAGSDHRDLVSRMAGVLSHRGPDQTATTNLALTVGGLGGVFGHTRLRVVDLSSAAAQPMTSADGDVVLTYNGEIYNHRALARELAALGLPVRSTGDTEVVLRAYEAWGPACIERLEGMFALAIWDGARGQVLLARDRTGKKPLFYATRGNRLAFASELKAILLAPWLSAEPEPSAVAQYLERGYVLAPGTMSRDVRQIMPAHLMIVCDGDVGAQRRWWRAPVTPTRRAGAALQRDVRRALEAAVEDRVQADVPVGVLLSGGVDSSVVTALAARSSPEERLRTFSIGFPDEPSFDERRHARLVAEHLDTRHEEFGVRVDAVGLLDEVLWHLDEPSGDSSAIPTYLAFQLASRTVRVVLTGDGGDEVFAGYDRFAAARIAQRIPRRAGLIARNASKRLRVGGRYFDPARRLQRFFEAADRPLAERYVAWISVFHGDELRRLVVPSVAAQTSAPGCLLADEDDDVRDLPDLDRIVRADMLTYLPGDLLVKVDRMSMAHSVEARSPFLDRRLVELLATVPAVDRIGLRRPKPLLRSSCRDLLPERIWNRPKHGFGLPVGAWMRGSLGTVFHDEVLAGDARTRAFLDQSAVRRLWSAHQAGDGEHGHRLWALLTLERWMRTAGDPAHTVRVSALSA